MKARKTIVSAVCGIVAALLLGAGSCESTSDPMETPIVVEMEDCDEEDQRNREAECFLQPKPKTSTNKGNNAPAPKPARTTKKG